MHLYTVHWLLFTPLEVKNDALYKEKRKVNVLVCLMRKIASKKEFLFE